MQSLIRRAKPIRLDPAPSRWAWRLQRLLLTPVFWLSLRIIVPFATTLAIGSWYLGDTERQANIQRMVAEARASIEERPEFQVKMMAIDGADDVLSRFVRETLPLNFPTSSFDLDLDAIRTVVDEIPSVKSVAVRIKPGGVLHLDITPRVAVALWRTKDGLALIDETGAYVAAAKQRDARPDLPLLAGDGANKHVPEALRLVAAAKPLGARLRGLVRMGERRWDVVLDRDQRILLPEINPLPVLERVIALEDAHDILTRNVARVDMRLAERATVQMNKEASDQWWAHKAAFGTGN